MQSIRHFRPLLWFLAISLVFLFMFSSCSQQIQKMAFPTLSDGKYDTEFPYRSCSQQLNEVMKTVKMVNCVAQYENYFYDYKHLYKNSKTALKNKQDETYYFTETASGTATVIYYYRNKIAIMTCAHIIDYPDTIVSYYDKSKIIKSIAIKKSQKNYIADFPGEKYFEVLAIDSKLDVAILGKDYRNYDPFPIPVFNYPQGKASELDWGSFVYLLGYPKGYQMVTRGIVSPNQKNPGASFLIDALFNRGFSGGIVLAIRDGVPNFEFVGMTNSVSADYKYVLTPGSNFNKNNYDPSLPYFGEVYISYKGDINYGITNAISSEKLNDFFNKNKNHMEEQGYLSEFFFKRVFSMK